MYWELRELKEINFGYMQDENLPKRGLLYAFDNLVKKVIPNFNLRAILYLSLIFAVFLYVQIWRISPPDKKPVIEKHETVIADDAYWNSQGYHDKITKQTVESFTHEFEMWLSGISPEFSRRKFEDMIFINGGLALESGTDPTTAAPENFNYLENVGRARYQYAKTNGFLSDQSPLVKLGTLVCNIDDRTEQVTGIDLYDWRYVSMPKLAMFMKTKPDWKMPLGTTILDVSDPRIEDRDILKLRTAETQPTGLFSFLIFHDPHTNRITLADSALLDKNGIDAKLTLSRIETHWNKQPKLYFTGGYEGCRHMITPPQIPYGQSD